MGSETKHGLEEESEELRLPWRLSPYLSCMWWRTCSSWMSQSMIWSSERLRPACLIFSSLQNNRDPDRETDQRRDGEGDGERETGTEGETEMERERRGGADGERETEGETERETRGEMGGETGERDGTKTKERWRDGERWEEKTEKERSGENEGENVKNSTRQQVFISHCSVSLRKAGTWSEAASYSNTLNKPSLKLQQLAKSLFTLNQRLCSQSSVHLSVTHTGSGGCSLLFFISQQAVLSAAPKPNWKHCTTHYPVCVYVCVCVCFHLFVQVKMKVFNLSSQLTQNLDTPLKILDVTYLLCPAVNL